jgi:Cu/Ag efflux protein CusF
MKQACAGVFVQLILVVLLAMPASAAEKKALERPSGFTSESASITATVEKIDYKKRTVVLKGPKGNLVEMQVGEEARNFNQVKKGDEVTFVYTESVAMEVRKAKGDARKIESTSTTRAKPGEKPAGTVKTTGIMTATVDAINYQTREVSLSLPEGNIMKLTVGPQVTRLDEVRKGDEVVVQYTTTVSISVKTPGKTP